MGGFHTYYGSTVVHPLGLAILFVLIAILLMVPRRLAFLPILTLACFIPSAQRIIIAGADFSFFRILIVFGFIRIISRGEAKSLKIITMDWLLIAWVVFGGLGYTLRIGTVDALVNRCGWALDVAGGYFLFRCLIRTWDDLKSIFDFTALLSVAVAALMAVEWSTGRNLFSVFGGVPSVTRVREGRLRCQGAFSHAILAGCFWALLIPGIVGRYWGESHRQRMIVSVVACFAIVGFSSSSTPLMTLTAGFLGIMLFRLRRSMQTLRWLTVIVLITLHFTMDKPIWHLMARADFVGGSTGWHRYVIFDTAIKHLSDWIALGVSNPLAWKVWQMRDITNQYLYEGFNGGGLALFFFLATMACGFVYVGRMVRALEGMPNQFFVWTLGVLLASHAVTFLGVTYFGQISALWHLSLAMIASVYVMSPEELGFEEYD